MSVYLDTPLSHKSSQTYVTAEFYYNTNSDYVRRRHRGSVGGGSQSVELLLEWDIV